VQAAATGPPVVQAHLTGPGDPQPSEGGAGSGAAGQQGAQQSVLRLEPLVGGHQFNHQFDGHAVRTDALAEQAPSDLQPGGKGDDDDDDQFLIDNTCDSNHCPNTQCTLPKGHDSLCSHQRVTGRLRSQGSAPTAVQGNETQQDSVASDAMDVAHPEPDLMRNASDASSNNDVSSLTLAQSPAGSASAANAASAASSSPPKDVTRVTRSFSAAMRNASDASSNNDVRSLTLAQSLPGSASAASAASAASSSPLKDVTRVTRSFSAASSSQSDQPISPDSRASGDAADNAAGNVALSPLMAFKDRLNGHEVDPKADNAGASEFIHQQVTTALKGNQANLEQFGHLMLEPSTDSDALQGAAKAVRDTIAPKSQLGQPNGTELQLGYRIVIGDEVNGYWATRLMNHFQSKDIDLYRDCEAEIYIEKLKSGLPIAFVVVEHGTETVLAAHHGRLYKCIGGDIVLYIALTGAREQVRANVESGEKANSFLMSVINEFVHTLARKGNGCGHLLTQSVGYMHRQKTVGGKKVVKQCDNSTTNVEGREAWKKHLSATHEGYIFAAQFTVKDKHWAEKGCGIMHRSIIVRDGVESLSSQPESPQWDVDPVVCAAQAAAFASRLAPSCGAEVDALQTAAFERNWRPQLRERGHVAGFAPPDIAMALLRISAAPA